MSPKEALQEIINNTPKDRIWYKVSSNYDEVNRLRITALRISRGDASSMQTDTLKSFFEKFGYEFETVVTKKI